MVTQETKNTKEMLMIMQKCDEHGFFIEKDMTDPNSAESKMLFNRENARMVKWRDMLPNIRQLIKEGNDKRSQ